MADLLLIEDDAQMLEVMRRALVEKGYQVLCARDGEEGMALFAASPVPLVITDVLMPQMDGVEVIQLLRQLAHPPRILAISGGGRYWLAEELLELVRKGSGVQTLAKPFRLEQLVGHVQRLLAGERFPGGGPGGEGLAMGHGTGSG